MEDYKGERRGDKEIVFSRTVKAGKRIYYIDVKENKKGELFLALTESKKVVMGDMETHSVNFEKHKIFLYQEDFEHFMRGLQEAIGYIRESQPGTEPRGTYHPEGDNHDHSSNLELDISMDEDEFKLSEE